MDLGTVRDAKDKLRSQPPGIWPLPSVVMSPPKESAGTTMVLKLYMGQNYLEGNSATTNQ